MYVGHFRGRSRHQGARADSADVGIVGGRGVLGHSVRPVRACRDRAGDSYANHLAWFLTRLHRLVTLVGNVSGVVRPVCSSLRTTGPSGHDRTRIRRVLALPARSADASARPRIVAEFDCSSRFRSLAKTASWLVVFRAWSNRSTVGLLLASVEIRPIVRWPFVHHRRGSAISARLQLTLAVAVLIRQLTAADRTADPRAARLIEGPPANMQSFRIAPAPRA